MRLRIYFGGASPNCGAGVRPYLIRRPALAHKNPTCFSRGSMSTKFGVICVISSTLLHFSCCKVKKNNSIINILFHNFNIICYYIFWYSFLASKHGQALFAKSLCPHITALGYFALNCLSSLASACFCKGVLVSFGFPDLSSPPT